MSKNSKLPTQDVHKMLFCRNLELLNALSHFLGKSLVNAMPVYSCDHLYCD